MLFFRVLILVILFTTVGLGFMFYGQLEPLAHGVYAFYKGEYYARKGEYTEAINSYKLALKGYPNPAEVYVHLGDAQVQMGKSRSARRSYRKALEISPGNEAAQARLAKRPSDQDAQDAGLGMFFDTLKGRSENTPLKEDMGDLYLSRARKSGKAEDYERAENVLKRFLEKHQHDDGARYKLGESLFAQGHYGEALDVYCDLAERHPTNPETLYSLAVTLVKNKAPREAYDTMMKAAEYAELTHPEWAQKWAAQAQGFRPGDSGPWQTVPEGVTQCMTRLATVEAEQAKLEE